MNKKQISKFLLGSIILLYAITSFISTWHVVEFFRLSNPTWLAVILAVAFEVGSAASLASILVLDKMNKTVIWSLFILLTLVQVNGNMYYAYTHLINYQSWIELFGLVDSEVIEQKRILSLVSGAILPIVALGFIKSLVDYIKPETENPEVRIPKDVFTSVTTDNEPVDISKLAEQKVDYDAIIKAGEEAQQAKIWEMVNKKRLERIDAGETFEDEPTALANSYTVENMGVVDDDESEPEEAQEPIVEENKEDEPKMKLLNNIKVFVNGEPK